MSRAPQTVRLRFHNPKYDRIVRLNTESIARKMGFSEDQVFDLSLAVEEAYTNAIEHGNQARGDGGSGTVVIELVYALHADRIEITIQDTGGGFCDDRPAAPPEDLADERADRGRGLTLIRQLSDRVDILSEPGAGTIIRICKLLGQD